jgi:hypothetical protein
MRGTILGSPAAKRQKKHSDAGQKSPPPPRHAEALDSLSSAGTQCSPQLPDSLAGFLESGRVHLTKEAAN